MIDLRLKSSLMASRLNYYGESHFGPYNFNQSGLL